MKYILLYSVQKRGHSRLDNYSMIDIDGTKDILIEIKRRLKPYASDYIFDVDLHVINPHHRQFSRKDLAENITKWQKQWEEEEESIDAALFESREREELARLKKKYESGTYVPATLKVNIEDYMP